MQRKEIQRGDLFYYDFGKREGSVQSGERPVMVIQADNFNANAPTIIVAAVTAVMKKKYLPSHIILGEDFGLKKPSMVLLEQIQTVNKDELTDYIGSVTSTTLWQFGHFSSITPVVIVTLSKIRQPQFLHLTIIFCSNDFIARSPPDKP